MWTGMENVGWGWIGFGVVHMLLFWGVVVFAFLALFGWLGPGEETPSATDILKSRYARGELTREQFEQMRRDIGEMKP